MKNQRLLTSAAALALSVPVAVFAQPQQDGPPPEGGPPGGGPQGHRPPPPIMMVLDANKDGVISAIEIQNAPQALKTLDKNGDGQLTHDELRPPPPPRHDQKNDDQQGGSSSNSSQ